MLHDSLKSDYLSDLRYRPEVRRKLPHLLEVIPEDAYPVREWSDALTYLYGVPLHFESAHDAKVYCRQHRLPATPFKEGFP